MALATYRLLAEGAPISPSRIAEEDGLTPERVEGLISEKDVVSEFCHFIHFFASREAGERWVAEHPRAILLSLEEGFELSGCAVAPAPSISWTRSRTSAVSAGPRTPRSHARSRLCRNLRREAESPASISSSPSSKQRSESQSAITAAAADASSGGVPGGRA